MRIQRSPRPQIVGDRIVSSSDGLLSFALTRSTSGVHVERRLIVNGSTLSLAVLLANWDEFARFRDSDRIRYEYPLTFRQLEVAFDELFAPS